MYFRDEYFIYLYIIAVIGAILLVFLHPLYTDSPLIVAPWVVLTYIFGCFLCVIALVIKRVLGNENKYG